MKVKSQEGEIFEINNDAIQKIELLKTIVDEYYNEVGEANEVNESGETNESSESNESSEASNPIQLDVSSQCLKQVIEFAKIDCAIGNTIEDDNIIDEWSQVDAIIGKERYSFIKGIPMIDRYSLLSVADYLNYHNLVHALSYVIAGEITGKHYTIMREKLGLENDYTDNELKVLDDEYSWLNYDY